MATLTLSRVQRDTLRCYINDEARTVAHDAFPQWGDILPNREAVYASVDKAREWLGVLDRIGWEIIGDAEEYTVELGGRQLELVLSLEDEIRQTYEYDRRDDDRAALEAVKSLKAVA